MTRIAKTNLMRLGAGVLALAVLAGCGRNDQKLVITGSSTLAPAITQVAEDYEAKTGIQVDVQSGGSGRGINDTRQGLADIGMVSRELKADESDLVPYEVATDGVAMIINKANPIQAISDDAIRAIYRGEISNWKQLGGDDHPINVVNKSQGRATLDLFLDYFGLDNRDIQADIVVGENQQGMKTVAGDRHAIGYVSIGAAEYEAENGTAIRLLPLEGVPATTAMVRQKRYPLRRELNLVTHGQPSDAARQFELFAGSQAAAESYRDQYYIPVEH